MVTVRFSKNKELILPRSLGETLGLREGDRVQIQRQDDVLQLQRRVTTSGRDTTPLAFENSHSDGTPLAFENSHSDGTLPPGPLTNLAKIISSSRSVGSVNIEAYMDKHGYEQVYDRVDF